jgi:hypothetical protein
MSVEVVLIEFLLLFINDKSFFAFSFAFILVYVFINIFVRAYFIISDIE